MQKKKQKNKNNLAYVMFVIALNMNCGDINGFISLLKSLYSAIQTVVTFAVRLKFDDGSEPDRSIVSAHYLFFV